MGVEERTLSLAQGRKWETLPSGKEKHKGETVLGRRRGRELERQKECEGVMMLGTWWAPSVLGWRRDRVTSCSPATEEGLWTLALMAQGKRRWLARGVSMEQGMEAWRKLWTSAVSSFYGAKTSCNPIFLVITLLIMPAPRYCQVNANIP